MLKNSGRVALRALRRHLGYTVLNVAGLAVGLGACLLIGLYVWHETTYDRFHGKADRIARVVESRTTPEGSEQVAETAAPVGPTLVEEVPGIEQMTRAATFFRLTMERGENRRYVGDYLMTEPSFIDVFDFPVATGDVRAALSRPGTVVLTHEAAQFYFGESNPVGKTLQVEWMGNVTVEAVLEPLPDRSHLQFSMLFPFATLEQKAGFWPDYVTDWTPDYRILSTYVVLEEGTSPVQVESQLTAFAERHHPEGTGPEAIGLQRLTDVHLYSAGIEGGYNAEPGHPAYVAIFTIIALFILAIAIINYVNIATARATERAREVGVRKALGARPAELVVQFVAEALALSSIAFLVGLGLARAAWPAFQTLAGVDISFALLGRPLVIGGLAVAVLLVAVLAGLYPAFVLTRFQPSHTLRARHTTSPGGSWLRRGLVVFQFALSIGLLIATFTVYQQLDYVQSKRLGFNEEHLVAIDINSNDVRKNVQTMKQEMLRHSAVRSVAVSSRVPGDWKGISEVEVARPEGDLHSAYFIGSDESFLETFEVDLKAGRTFDSRRAADTSAVLLNETAVRELGLSEPVGTTLNVPKAGLEGGGQTAAGFAFRVIGVVEDFHFHSLHRPIEPLLLGYADNPIDQIDYFTACVDGDQMTAAIDHLRGVSTTFDPGRPFEYNLLDEQIAAKYETDRRVGRLFGIAAALAIVIACIGLFGLAAFTVRQRQKEIGIRKVLGATVTSVVTLLSKQYAILVGAAFVVAAPASYVAMRWWLQDFAYRIDIGIGLLVGAGGLALLIALATVSTQALRAARIDPAQTLRSE